MSEKGGWIPDKFSTMAHLGKNVIETNYMKGVEDTAKEIIKSNVLGESKNKIVILNNKTKAKEIVKNIEGNTFDNVRTVAELKFTLSDKNKTDAQKEIAKNTLNILTDSVFLAMRDGGDNEMVRVLGIGTDNEIRNVLPEPFKDIEKEVKKKVISNPDVKASLDRLDGFYEKTKSMLAGGESRMKKEIDKEIDFLFGLDVPEKDNDQWKMVMSYLSSFMLGEKDDGGVEHKVKNVDESEDKIGKSSLLDQMAEDIKRSADSAEVSAKQAKSRYELEKDVREVSLSEQLDAYLYIKAPRERAPQQWEYDVPIEGMDRETWRKLLNFQDQWLAAIYNKRADSAYNVSLEKMKDGILGMKSLEEADLKFWYENKTIKLKEVMHEISRELLTTEIVISGNEERTIYAFATEPERDKDGKFKKDENNELTGKKQYLLGSRVQELVNNEANYKISLAKRLVEKKIVKNINVAELSVAMAMDIMEMGGVFAVADGLRKLSWESDALRLAQRPERKFSSKVGSGELFAGPWTELANTLGEGNPNKAMELIKSWKVVPDLLSGSFLDQKLYLANGEKTEKTMMEMIYDNDKIPFRDLGNDLYFLWRKDHVMPAARTWLYIANKVPLEFSRNRENDTVISQWRSDLYNDINQLRKNKDCILPTSVVAGAIGGSLGLWPFEGPYLRVSSDDSGGSTLDYFSAATEVIRLIGLPESERKEIQEFFGIDRKYNRDLSDKFVAYTAVRNVTQPQWYKEKNKKVLLRPRGKK